MADEDMINRRGISPICHIGGLGIVCGISTTGVEEGGGDQDGTSWTEIDTGLENVLGFTVCPYAANIVAENTAGGVRDDHLVELSYAIQTDTSKVRVYSCEMTDDAAPDEVHSVIFSWIAMGTLAANNALPTVTVNSDQSAAA